MHFYAKEICLCARHFTEDCLLIERMGVGFPRRHTFLRDTETDSEVIAQVLERSSKASYAHRSLARQHKYALLVFDCPAVKRHGIRIQEMCLTVNKILGYSIDCCRFYCYNFQPQLLSPPPWVCSKSFSQYEKKTVQPVHKPGRCSTCNKSIFMCLCLHTSARNASDGRHRH